MNEQDNQGLKHIKHPEIGLKTHFSDTPEWDIIIWIHLYHQSFLNILKCQPDMTKFKKDLNWKMNTITDEAMNLFFFLKRGEM